MYRLYRGNQINQIGATRQGRPCTGVYRCWPLEPLEDCKWQGSSSYMARRVQARRTFYNSRSRQRAVGSAQDRSSWRASPERPQRKLHLEPESAMSKRGRFTLIVSGRWRNHLLRIPPKESQRGTSRPTRSTYYVGASTPTTLSSTGTNQTASTLATVSIASTTPTGSEKCRVHGGEAKFDNSQSDGSCGSLTKNSWTLRSSSRWRRNSRTSRKHLASGSSMKHRTFPLLRWIWCGIGLSPWMRCSS